MAPDQNNSGQADHTPFAADAAAKNGENGGRGENGESGETGANAGSEAPATERLALRYLAAVDRVLAEPGVAALAQRYGRETLKDALRNLQAEWRGLGHAPGWAADPAAYRQPLGRALRTRDYQRVFNLTGTLLHSNLGRAPLSQAVLERVVELITRPATIEYRLDQGRRGDRDQPVADRLRLLTGAEDVTVVNNNAAAVVLVLNSLALGRPVPVSRGELIEIGGSFRLPEIMERAGCHLVEVGATNRTHGYDYERALTPETGCVLKIHPSNYHIEGFTAEVDTPALARLTREAGVPLCVDLGSGALVDFTQWGLPKEPTPQETLRQGADLVTFSGDKLLGSVQCGIIAGRKDLIAQLKKNPLKRALRPDKVTLALLQETLKLYEAPEALPQELPLLQALLTPDEELERRAEAIRDSLTPLLGGYTIAVEASPCVLGSGSLPDQELPSLAVTITADKNAKLRELETRLRALPVPVIGRIARDRLWLDMRGAAELPQLQASLAMLASARPAG